MKKLGIKLTMLTLIVFVASYSVHAGDRIQKKDQMKEQQDQPDGYPLHDGSCQLTQDQQAELDALYVAFQAEMDFLHTRLRLKDMADCKKTYEDAVQAKLYEWGYLHEYCEN